MAKPQTLKRIGGSVGTILPKSMLERFHLGAGDKVFVVENEEELLIADVRLPVSERHRARRA